MLKFESFPPTPENTSWTPFALDEFGFMARDMAECRRRGEPPMTFRLLFFAQLAGNLVAANTTDLASQLAIGRQLARTMGPDLISDRIAFDGFASGFCYGADLPKGSFNYEEETA